MSLNHIYAVALGAGLVLGVPKQEGAVDPIIDKAVATYNSTRTSKGTFEQVITNPLTGSKANASGEFEQQRQPAKFSFRFVQPKGDMRSGLRYETNCN